MAGAVTAGLVLEVLKRGFGLYVTTFPTYQTIYGALATIPLFLIWMYVMWNVVLYGAEMAAALPEWRVRRQPPRKRPAHAGGRAGGGGIGAGPACWRRIAAAGACVGATCCAAAASPPSC